MPLGFRWEAVSGFGVDGSLLSGVKERIISRWIRVSRRNAFSG